MKVTLLQKRGNVEEKEFRTELDRAIQILIDRLSATATFNSFTQQGWTIVNVDGADAEVVVELLSQTFGLATTDVAKVEPHGNYRGVVRSLSSSGLFVDIGIEHPKPTFVNVKLSSLQAQLADGIQSTSNRTIAQNYCIFPEMPSSIRVTSSTPNEIEGWLSDSQISLFSNWITSGLERIQVFSCLASQLESAIRKAQLERDIVSAEKLSLTVQSMVCKIGTDAIGLIPRVGSILKNSQLRPFIPRRIEAECRVWQNIVY
jgi:hypothetical protein